MNNIGTILELEGRRAFIMTKDSRFYIIKRCPGMYIGQQIMFSIEDICKEENNQKRYWGVAAGIAALLVLVFSFFYIRAVTRDQVYAYVDVDINPSIELALNREEVVIEARAMNSDGIDLLKNLNFKGLHLSKALESVLSESHEMGFISSERRNTVLISALVCESGKDKANEEKVFLNKLKVIESGFDKRYDEIDRQVVLVSSDSREMAVKNKISMGRYFIYETAKDKGINITIAEAKKIGLVEAFGILGIDQSKTPLVADTSQLKENNSEENDSNTEAVNTPPSTPTKESDKGGQDSSKNDNNPVSYASTANSSTEDGKQSSTNVKPVINMPENSEPTEKPLEAPREASAQYTKEPSVGKATWTPVPTLTPTPFKSVSESPVSTPAFDGTEKNTEPPLATGVPGEIELGVNNWNGEAYYVISANMWWGNNGTVFNLYENDVLVYTTPMRDNSPHRQTASVYMQNKPKGNYKYRGELVNQYGKSTATLDIEVVK
ncbi:MAG: anti-sigma factor domain-containing protein [Clostridia bacterium]|nr:anti-sigma factor domain-containing protein [Clostridia bacterium]